MQGGEIGMNLMSCECGVVLDLDSDIVLHKDDQRQFYFYICPVCKTKIDIE